MRTRPRPSCRLTQFLFVLALVTFAVAAGGDPCRAADAATEVAPDPRWSLIYQVGERAAPDPAGPAPEVRRHSSLVQAPWLTPQDSPDVAVLPSSGVTQSEVSTFIDPNDPDVVLVSANATDWPVTTVFGTGMYWSTDGGATWTGNDNGPGGVGNSGDPAAVIRAVDGRWVVGYISSGFGQGVSYSTNQGATWSHVNLFPSGTLDKNHLMVDNVPSSPHYGNLYSAWTDFSTGIPNDIDIVRSTDGGATWDATATNISAAVTAGNHNQGVNIQVGPNGEVYACWVVYDCWPCEEVAIGLNVSTNGGASWNGESRVITNIRGHRNTALPNSLGERRNSFPSMAVDVSGGPNDGAVYIVWTNQGVPGVNSGDVDIYLAKSTDGGASFQTPVRVNQDATANAQWFPWISCDPTSGLLSVVFYDRRDDPGDTLARAYMATSADGGATWEDFPVADVSFTPSPIPGLAGGYMGDYLGIAVHSGKAYPTWPDNRSGNYLAYVSPILLQDTADPNPPSAVSAASDFTTPTGAQVDWTDPSTTVGGAALTDFSIDILRDDVFLANVDQGNGTFTDGSLTDGQSYQYTLITRDDVTDSTSTGVNATVFAGGAPTPAAPSNPGCSADTTSAALTWTNPSTQADGTPLDDFAGVRIYRDGGLLVELARTAGDAGSSDTYTDNPPFGVTYAYEISAIDDEPTVHESARTSLGSCFVGGPPMIAVGPGSLDYSLPPSTSQTKTVTIDNPGYGFLDYTLALSGLGGGGRDQFGSTANSTNAGQGYRGNVYQMDSNVSLTLIDQRLNITASTTLEFFVYENTAATGVFTKVFSTQTASGTGNQFFSSGPIDVPLQAGNFYLIGCGWSSAVVTFDDAGGTGLPAAVSFGQVTSRAGGVVFPPPATSNVGGTGSQVTSMAVETSTPATAQLLSATAGSVPPLGSVLVDIQANASAALGMVAGSLQITHNAAGSPGSVPITIDVNNGAVDSPVLGPPVPLALALHPPVPNPFRRVTTIRYDLPRPGAVHLAVYDVTGRLVRTLVDRVEEAGFRSVVWDGKDTGGQRVSSGVFFYALETAEGSVRRKVVLLR
jgi:hypothetical protein